MGHHSRIFTVIMFPLGVLIIVEAMGLYTLTLPVDKVLVAAALTLGFQGYNLFLSVVHNRTLRPIQALTTLILVSPSLAYFFGGFLPSTITGYVPLAIGIVMVLESLWTLH